MSKIRASAILSLSIAVAVLAGCLLAYPLALGFWAELQARHAQERDFVAASDSDQDMIVRSLLINEINKPPLCSPSVKCTKEPMYFDRLSATLRSADHGGPWSKYEVMTIRPDGSLVDRGDSSRPIPLQELLDRLSQVQTYNANPMLPGVIYARNPEELPLLGEPDSCSDSSSISPRLVRIGRAAVQESKGLALVLIARTFCDGGGVPRVAELHRDRSEWRVISDY